MNREKERQNLEYYPGITRAQNGGNKLSADSHVLHYCIRLLSLFQALCQCGRLKKWAGDGSRSQLIPLVARSLFLSFSLTESLEQAIDFLPAHIFSKPFCFLAED